MITAFSAAYKRVHVSTPGFVGRFASLLGQAGINIATFHLGREAEGGNAIALVEVDGTVPVDVLTKVHEIPNVQQVEPLVF
jgi:D-3-phosphoglycerate dehydrogenase